MSRLAKRIGTGLLAGVFVAMLGAGVWWTSFSDYWVREQPLANPIRVVSVSEGMLTLQDGRRFAPAGIARRSDVSVVEFDGFLNAVVAQGIEIDRDLGDGLALLVAEPKFYNWCGTRGAFQRYWAGCYVQIPVSEMMVIGGYADPVAAEWLTEPERQQIAGCVLLRTDDRPRRHVDRMIEVDSDVLFLSSGHTLRDLIELHRDIGLELRGTAATPPPAVLSPDAP